MKWPNDFKELVADRKEKGFNVVQVVAGLFPEFDEPLPEYAANKPADQSLVELPAQAGQFPAVWWRNLRPMDSLRIFLCNDGFTAYLGKIIRT